MTTAQQHQRMRSSGPPPDVLRVEGLQVDRLGQPVVRGVDLSVASGQVTVLLGANGAGKSTLLDGISGVVRPSAGRVLLDGEDITRSSRQHRVHAGLAYVQQGRTVFEALTVEENFLVTAGRADLSPAFELFPELKARAAIAAGLLSGGEQQMVVLGRAALRQPRVLMIDELSLGLAPVVIDRMLQAVEHMAGTGVAMLLVEQFADRALSVGDSAVVMTRGHIVLRGAASHIRKQPDRLRAAYLGSVESNLSAVGDSGPPAAVLIEPGAAGSDASAASDGSNRR
ncbi:MAG: ABC transporter ATP-binding protein [Acidimicrobiaceae bacterium]|nr:ABC transporter ATP-binding protein [Acidimicrobiaceae bacterium]